MHSVSHYPSDLELLEIVEKGIMVIYLIQDQQIIAHGLNLVHYLCL